jgi:hypothetical protein
VVAPSAKAPATQVAGHLGHLAHAAGATGCTPRARGTNLRGTGTGWTTNATLAAGNVERASANGGGSEMVVGVPSEIEADERLGDGNALGPPEDPRRYVEQTAPAPSLRRMASVWQSSVASDLVSTRGVEALIHLPSAARARRCLPRS